MREKKEINIQIGEQVRCARENARFTQEQLAESIDVSSQFVSDLERGIFGLSVSTLKRICVVLNVSSDQILFGASKKRDFSIVTEKCNTLSDIHFEMLCSIIDKFIEAVNHTKE